MVRAIKSNALQRPFSLKLNYEGTWPGLVSFSTEKAQISIILLGYKDHFGFNWSTGYVTERVKFVWAFQVR